MAEEIIHEENGEWYFWQECWSERMGPYPTRKVAERKLKLYIVHTIEGGWLRYYWNKVRYFGRKWWQHWVHP